MGPRAQYLNVTVVLMVVIVIFHGHAYVHLDGKVHDVELMSTSAGGRQTDVAINLVVLTLLEVTDVPVIPVISWGVTRERAMTLMSAVGTRTHVATKKVAGILEAVTDVPVRQDITWMMIKELAKI